MNHKTIFITFVTLMTTLLAGNQSALHAQPKRTADDIAATISPFVEESTVAVIRVDLTRVQLDPAFKRFKGLLEKVVGGKGGNLDLATMTRQIDAAQTMVQMYVSALTKAGATEAFAVISLESLPGTPLMVVIPAGDGVDVDALTPLLQMVSIQMPVEQEKIGEAIVIGTKTDLARIKKGNKGKLSKSGQVDQSVDRTAVLKKTFAATGNAPIQLVIMPPRYVRRAIEETVTSLPEHVGGGSSKILTDGFAWAAVGVTLPPTFKFEATVQSSNAAAAAAFAAMIKTSLSSLQAESEGEMSDSMIKRLLPKVVDDQVKWLLTDKDLDGFAGDLKLIVGAEQRQQIK